MKRIINGYVCKTLHSSRKIKKMVRILAEKIANDYRGKEFTLLIVANGAMDFGLDLSRALEKMDIKHSRETIIASRYNGDNNGGAEVNIIHKPNLKIAGRNIIVVEDLVDEGITLNQLSLYLENLKPASLNYAVLGTKHGHRFGGELKYKAFEKDFPDEWLLGYGMDWENEYRSLEEILYKTNVMAA